MLFTLTKALNLMMRPEIRFPCGKLMSLITVLDSTEILKFSIDSSPFAWWSDIRTVGSWTLGGEGLLTNTPDWRLSLLDFKLYVMKSSTHTLKFTPTRPLVCAMLMPEEDVNLQFIINFVAKEIWTWCLNKGKFLASCSWTQIQPSNLGLITLTLNGL